jgi:hypothetical protein
MGTSSKYSKNKIEQVIDDNTFHLITKSYISANFESERRKTEYHVYWVNENRGENEDLEGFKNLSNRKLNKNELKFFFNNIHLYELKEDNKYGCIWENKKIGFDKNKVIISQLSFF